MEKLVELLLLLLLLLLFVNLWVANPANEEQHNVNPVI